MEGTWRPEHLFELRQAHELYQFHHRQITECDQQIQAELAKFANRAGEKTRTGKPRKRGRKSNDVRFEATGPLFQALGVDLTLIEGIDVGTALVILAEIGVDVSRFPTEKHFASWLRLCPPQDESNKTKKRRGHRKGTNRVTIALRMAARSAGKTMTPLGLFYRRIRSRIGGLGAVKATAHKLACLVYRMLKYGQEYVTQSMEEYEAKMKANMLEVAEAESGGDGLPTQSATHAIGSRSRPSPSRDRPVATHNAEKPTPRASVRNAGGLGEIMGVVQHSSQKNPHAVTAACRAGEFMGR